MNLIKKKVKLPGHDLHLYTVVRSNPFQLNPSCRKLVHTIHYRSPFSVKNKQ